MSCGSQRYEDTSGRPVTAKTWQALRNWIPAKYEMNDFILHHRLKSLISHASYAANPNFLYLGGSFRQLEARDGRHG
jgi:hypothetical protein